MEKLAREGRLDLATVFDRLPTPFMVLDREFRYVGMNEAYLRVTSRTRESVIGRHIFDAFPEEGEARRQLEDSLNRALESGRTDYIPFIKYAIPRPESEGGGFMERYWSCTHTPIPDAEGRTEFIVQHTQDITELHSLRVRAEPGASDTLGLDVLKRAQSAQAQTEEFRNLFAAAPGFMCVLRAPDYVFEWANDAYFTLVGNRDMIGLPLAQAMPEIVGQGYLERLDTVVKTREPFVARAATIRLQHDREAPPEDRILDFIYQPIITAGGVVSGVFVQGQDVTEMARAGEKQRLLLDELNHRVKNTLATVQAIVAQTLRAGRATEEFAEDFQARLLALSNTHDALTGGQWHGVDLEGMLQTALGPYAGGQIRLDGPPVILPPGAALPFGMVLHELATNAAKYGSLSRPEGRLSVTWRADDGALNLDWIETGGPPVTTPKRRSFGTRLIQRTLTGELNGAVTLDFPMEGLRCSMQMPLKG